MPRGGEHAELLARIGELESKLDTMTNDKNQAMKQRNKADREKKEALARVDGGLGFLHATGTAVYVQLRASTLKIEDSSVVSRSAWNTFIRTGSHTHNKQTS